MTATFTSNRVAFERDFNDAVADGLMAATVGYRDAVRERLRQGYTTGAFTTGKAAENVITSDVVTEDGVRVIRVGTEWERALEWELGFLNKWTDQWERVPIWVPIATQQASSIVQAVVNGARPRLAKWRAA